MDHTIKKTKTYMSEFKNGWTIYCGEDACLRCKGSGSIFIHTSDHLVSHCETCPNCKGYRTTNGLTKYEEKKHLLQHMKGT